MKLIAGVMTGTSMDAIDIAVLQMGETVTLGQVRQDISLRGFFSRPIDAALREALFELQQRGDDELHRSALVANSLADAISRTVLECLVHLELSRRDVIALGVHGQTLRHQPRLGYSIQLNAPARIAETTGITVVSDFRSRDIAAAGQGAPLVPAFHQALFADPKVLRAVVNIGGIANITWLGPMLLGYDTGPGNLLMDAWTERHLGQAFDTNGQWAQSGQAHKLLLKAMLGDPFFAYAPPRSTGRELFNAAWIDSFLCQSAFAGIAAQDVQATLLALTADSIANEIARLERLAKNERQPLCDQVLICGGGARNSALMQRLSESIRKAVGRDLPVQSTEAMGWSPQAIEAAAFAWLASRTLAGQPGNCPSVTGAIGPRILGSITPA
jgi:anhydro-N-acetylmuramic acid kinase